MYDTGFFIYFWLAIFHRSQNVLKIGEILRPLCPERDVVEDPTDVGGGLEGGNSRTRVS